MAGKLGKNKLENNWKVSGRDLIGYYFILLWLYSPLLGLGRIFNFLMYTQSVGLLGRGISPSQGLYLHIE
jgi:hypothetical protein